MMYVAFTIYGQANFKNFADVRLCFKTERQSSEVFVISSKLSFESKGLHKSSSVPLLKTCLFRYKKDQSNLENVNGYPSAK